ncbi:MAG: cytochrome c oxidase accessory protein CcoG, partial [Comamonadaceae bacterium]
MSEPNSSGTPRRVVPIASAALAQDESIQLYAAAKKVYPRSISGVFARWRWAMVWLTQIVFYGLPWLHWGERQAVLFDLAVRRFYLFGLVLYPQDLIYLAGLLVISALALFLFTAVAGRLWCGYTCPQTVYTEIFMWVEHHVEGNRVARMRLDDSALSARKLGKKTLKHLIWLAIALWTGFTFVGYFTPIQVLGLEIVQANMGSWEVFWVLFYGFATYGNAGFMREQVCKYMCPYARFQSAMFDADTLVVGYDTERGEPRAPRGRSVDHKARGLGDCIDCGLCVQVCPTGIDIRNGLQSDCIGCGLCVDACNTVMDKMNYPKGLVRYDTTHGMAHRWSARQLLRRVARPRVLIYSAVLAALVIGMVASLVVRAPLKVTVVRDRASLARIAPGGRLENVYRLQIMNATERTQRYDVQAEGIEGITALTDESAIEVGPAESRFVAVRLQIPYDALPPGSHVVHIGVREEGS